jgi:hypothetical protein
MPEDIFLHVARAHGETPQGGEVKVSGYSGNMQGLGKTRLSAAAMIFRNYLDDLESAGGDGGRTAFTCAEPKAVLAALNAGANFESVWLYQIRCKGENRAPCNAWCSQYLVASDRGYGYMLDPALCRQLQRHMPNYGTPRPRPRVQDDEDPSFTMVYNRR